MTWARERNLDVAPPARSPGRTRCRGRTRNRRKCSRPGTRRDGIGRCLEELLGAFVRVEHAQLQVEDGLAGHREVEMAGLDDAGVHGAHGNLEHAFAQRRPVDVPLAFEGRQDLSQRKVLAQRMHVRPVVVQRHAARIGVAGGFEAEPVLDLALLPVHGGQLARRAKGSCGSPAGIRALAGSGSRARPAVRRRSSCRRRLPRPRGLRRTQPPAGRRIR